jgi:hypothetical protein
LPVPNLVPLYYLAKHTEKQYFISTHSNIFLDSVITDNLVSDLIVLTEGPYDRPVLIDFLLKMDLYNRFNIKFWPLGGDIMDKLDLSVFSELYNIVALVDKDPGSTKTRNKFMKNCKGYGIKVHRLERYALENYFTLSALRQVFRDRIPKDLTSLDPDKKLEDQIGLNPRKKNKEIASKMSIEDIENTDLYSFFKNVESILLENVAEGNVNGRSGKKTQGKMKSFEGVGKSGGLGI